MEKKDEELRKREKEIKEEEGGRGAINFCASLPQNEHLEK